MAPADYKTNNNPGFGPCAGKIDDPFGGILQVEWADNQRLAIHRTQCRVALPDGATVSDNGKQFTIHYTATGVILRPVQTTPSKTPKKGKMTRSNHWKSRAVRRNPRRSPTVTPTKKPVKKRKIMARKSRRPKKKKKKADKNNHESECESPGQNKEKQNADKNNHESECESPGQNKEKQNADKNNHESECEKHEWAYINPKTDEQFDTCVMIPGVAFDTITEGIIEIKAMLPQGYLLCVDGIKRNNRHVRALTEEEAAAHEKNPNAGDGYGEAEWAPCENVEALDVHVQARMIDCIKQAKYKHSNPHLFHLFFERVAKVYNHLAGKNAEDSDAGMHADRGELCYVACQRVLEQIPIRQRPFKGSARRASKTVMPILEELLEMPSRGPPVGSQDWIVAMKNDPGVITFKHMAEYRPLMRCYVNWALKTLFNARGALRLHDGEHVPTGKYKPSKAPPMGAMIKSTRRAMHKHKDFKLMRAGAVFWALEKMRDDGTYPRKMHPETLPKQCKKWDNYNKCKLHFHALYCYAQGPNNLHPIHNNVRTDIFESSACIIITSA